MHDARACLLQGAARVLVKEDRSWGRMISRPCPISWRKNTALLQCDLFKEGPLYGLGRVELTSQAGHYSTSSSCPRFSQSSWPLLSFLPGKLCILSVHLLPPASGGQHSAESCCVIRTEFTRGFFLSSAESSSLWGGSKRQDTVDKLCSGPKHHR